MKNRARYSMQRQSTTATACFSRPAGCRHRAARRALAVCLLLAASGCSLLRPPPEPPPEPVLEPIVITGSRREPPPPPEPAPAPPEARPEPPPEPEPVVPETGRIAILLSNRSPAYENVAIELSRQLGRFLLYNLGDRSLSPKTVFAGIADSDAEVVIAIGLQATEQAMALSPLPIVFCQVFNIDVSASAAPVRGVAAIPPLAPQVQAWKAMRPELETIGTILGVGHEALIAEAQVATAESGVGFHYRIAGSDRETLYVFNRMAREIDGFWLFPDNRVLSIPVLKEMLAYASRHQVQIAVFNPALLELGAELSIVSDEADVAATAIAVAERIMDGGLDDIPMWTPLSRVDVRMASAAAAGGAAKGTR